MTDPSQDYQLSVIEELTLCGHCTRPFNDSNLLPKDLTCKHTFCLECIQTGLGKASVAKGSAARLGELYCELCWKLTELTEKGPQALATNEPKLQLVKMCMTLKCTQNATTNGDTLVGNPPLHEENRLDPCPIHGAALRLWCIDCEKPLCSECRKSLHVEPRDHRIWTLEQAKEQMKKEAYAELSCMTHMDDNVRQLARRQRQFLILIRDACTALMREVQSNLDSDWNVDPTAEIREALTHIQIRLMDAKTPKDVHDLFSVLLLKKQSLQTKCQEMILQCQLNDLIGHSQIIFNFDSLRQAVASILSNESEIDPIPLQQPLQDPILLLANYCMSQLFSQMHQGARGDSMLLNHSMQQLGVSSPDLPIDPILSSMPTSGLPTPPPSLPLNAHPDIFITPNESNEPQVEYPQHQPVKQPIPVLFENQPDVEVSRPPTPPDTFPSPPIQQVASKAFTPPPATTAQIVQMHPSLADRVEAPAPIIHPPVRPVPTRSPASNSPRYYFNIDISGVSKGRIVIETRPDVAPKMCRNFDRLTTADRRASYKSCSIFQCWKNESVITGDYEFNTGRGGRSIYEEPYFQPDDTRLPAIRSAVGMRRQQKKHDYFGYVGSQFRIILQDTQNFTGIFGHVIEGIELVDLIASHGDSTGKPFKPITITKCGKL